LSSEIFSCRLCDSENVDNLIELDDFPQASQHFLDKPSDWACDAAITLKISQCGSCGLVQLRNDPVHYFRDVITAASLSEKSKSSLVQEWTPFIEKFGLLGKSAIEIGSSRGDFLEVLERLGLKAVGIEHSHENIQESLKKGLTVERAYLLGVSDFLEGKYDLVVCNNFLEHQPQTRNFIRNLHALVREDGFIYISVPNLEYLLNKSCLYEFVVDHLVYFTEKTLKLAFEINGFEIIDQYKKNNGNDLVLIAKPRNRIDLAPAKKTVDKILLSIKKVTSNAIKSNKRIAVWGAGHRALALMAMADLQEIEYVVDSASFKQDKYTPILHKKIISPEDFLTMGCNLLIVMLPGSYAQQITSFLKENKCEVEVLVFEDEVLLAS